MKARSGEAVWSRDEVGQQSDKRTHSAEANDLPKPVGTVGSVFFPSPASKKKVIGPGAVRKEDCLKIANKWLRNSHGIWRVRGQQDQAPRYFDTPWCDPFGELELAQHRACSERESHLWDVFSYVRIKEASRTLASISRPSRGRFFR